MINKDTLEVLNEIGYGADIDGFETYVGKLKDAYGMGNPLVDDATYDWYYSILKELKPQSSIFGINNESYDEELNEYDKILLEYGMCSIHTIDGIEYSEVKTMADVIDNAGQEEVELFASLKENGHAARIVYVKGELVEASTRGRRNNSKGRDITRHMRLLVPNHIKEFESMPLVEIRGEVIVNRDTFDNTLVNWGLKTPLSSVTSLIRESATDEEIKMLSFVAYKVIPSDIEMRVSKLSIEFSILEKLGFEVPPSAVIRVKSGDYLVGAIYTLLEYFENYVEDNDYQYDTDGFVVAVNESDIFYGAGKEENHWKANLAVKEGDTWERNIYSSTIEEIEFTHGKKYLTPKAIIEPVTCRNGATVRNVPLYNIGVMDRYGYVTGATIYFKFGGETGVTLCDVHGRSVRVDYYSN